MSCATEVFTLGHSPDPDDAFMFYAIAKNKIDLRGYRFEHRLEDIQTLNERAMRGELHISAISIHTYAYVADKYALLPCGASMGDGYGPILIRKRSTLNVQRPTSNSNARDELRGQVIAVHGARAASRPLASVSGRGRFGYRRPGSAARSKPTRQRHDVRSRDPRGFELFVRGPRIRHRTHGQVPEHRRRAALGERGQHGFAQAAFGVVILGHDDRAGVGRGLRDRLGVQRLD